MQYCPYSILFVLPCQEPTHHVMTINLSTNHIDCFVNCENCDSCLISATAVEYNTEGPG